MTTLPQMITYTNKSLLISVQIPEQWQQQQLQDNQFVVVGPETSKFDGYRPQISYTKTVPENDSEAWLESLIKQSEIQQRNAYNGYQVVREERFKLGEYKSYLRHSEWQYAGTEVHLTNVQGLILVNADTVYIAKAETLKEFAPTDLPIFETMIKSTQILSPSA